MRQFQNLTDFYLTMKNKNDVDKNRRYLINVEKTRRARHNVSSFNIRYFSAYPPRLELPTREPTILVDAVRASYS